LKARQHLEPKASAGAGKYVAPAATFGPLNSLPTTKVAMRELRLTLLGTKKKPLRERLLPYRMVIHAPSR
jgi:hypothetical protein